MRNRRIKGCANGSSPGRKAKPDWFQQTMKKLTPKQQCFVDEYLIDLNATQAAIRAGYSKKTAASQGERLLRNVEIQSSLSARMKARELRTEITQDRVLRELAKIGFADIRRALQWGASVAVTDEDTGDTTIAHGIYMVPSDQIDDDTAAAISEIAETQQGLKVKFHDKQGALVSIGRHLGMFKDKVELTGKNGGPIETSNAQDLTKDELEAELKRYGIKPEVAGPTA